MGRHGLRPIGTVATRCGRVIAGYSKEEETEADVNAVRLTPAAGYDACAAAHSFRRMQPPAEVRRPAEPIEAARATAASPADYLRSHPSPPERARTVERAAAELL